MPVCTMYVNWKTYGNLTDGDLRGSPAEVSDRFRGRGGHRER